MYYIKAIIFGFGFPGVFFMGAVHPILGWLSLAVWLFVLLPMFWRATVIHKTEQDYKRRKRNIETQIIRGRLDSQLIQETAAEMKRDGRL